MDSTQTTVLDAPVQQLSSTERAEYNQLKAIFAIHAAQRMAGSSSLISDNLSKHEIQIRVAKHSKTILDNPDHETIIFIKSGLANRTHAYILSNLDTLTIDLRML